ILLQRLWQRDIGTSADAATLRQRIHERPGSVCVVRLDDTAVPTWLASSEQFDLTEGGLRNAATFTLDAISSCGGTVVGERAQATPVEALPGQRPYAPPPFLLQPRAHASLRRELDALTTAIESHVRQRRADVPGGVFEIHALPFRVIARLDD